MSTDPAAIVADPAGTPSLASTPSFDPVCLDPQQQAELVRAYATPIRAYHHLGHVLEVQRHYRAIATGPGWHRPREAWLAILYHDAIHRPGRRDNEARSARLAVQAIGRYLQGSGIDAARVARLIELTARHGHLSRQDLGTGADAADAAHFLDCDMAILGAMPAEFDAYDAAIAQEYRGAVPAQVFRAGRRRFLQGLLDSERIYLSDWFHQRLDAPARANLRRALLVGPEA